VRSDLQRRRVSQQRIACFLGIICYGIFTEGNASRFDHHFPDPVITTGATITPVPGTSQAS
jgi:hypothetical protein